jgi:hypothetical protein
METALRVLTAVVDHRDPATADVHELRLFVPLSDDTPPDELAREVVQLARDVIHEDLKLREGVHEMQGLAGHAEA